MSKRFEKMTPREKFVRLMIRGWKEKKKGYTSDVYKDSKGFCAYGVVADELGLDPYQQGSMTELVHRLGGGLPFGITGVSDRAGSKTAAIRAVKNFLLG